MLSAERGVQCHVIEHTIRSLASECTGQSLEVLKLYLERQAQWKFDFLGGVEVSWMDEFEVRIPVQALNRLCGEQWSHDPIDKQSKPTTSGA